MLADCRTRSDCAECMGTSSQNFDTDRIHVRRVIQANYIPDSLILQSTRRATESVVSTIVL